MSPDVKNSIHVGDRILEINGTPIRNVPLDEVWVLGLGPEQHLRWWLHVYPLLLGTHLATYLLSPD